MIYTQNIATSGKEKFSGNATENKLLQLVSGTENINNSLLQDININSSNKDINLVQHINKIHPGFIDSHPGCPASTSYRFKLSCMSNCDKKLSGDNENQSVKRSLSTKYNKSSMELEASLEYGLSTGGYDIFLNNSAVESAWDIINNMAKESVLLDLEKSVTDGMFCNPDSASTINLSSKVKNFYVETLAKLIIEAIKSGIPIYDRSGDEIYQQCLKSLKNKDLECQKVIHPSLPILVYSFVNKFGDKGVRKSLKKMKKSHQYNKCYKNCKNENQNFDLNNNNVNNVVSYNDLLNQENPKSKIKLRDIIKYNKFSKQKEKKQTTDNNNNNKLSNDLNGLDILSKLSSASLIIHTD